MKNRIKKKIDSLKGKPIVFNYLSFKEISALNKDNNIDLIGQRARYDHMNKTIFKLFYKPISRI